MEEEFRNSAVWNITLCMNPHWDERFDFGVNEWCWFTVQVLDDSTKSLSNVLTYVLSKHTVETGIMMNAFQGSIFFDYRYQVQA